MTLCFTKGKFRPRDRHIQRELHMKIEAEIGVMYLQTKESQRWPATQQKLGENHGTVSPSQPSDGTNPANKNCETINFCCLSYLVCGTLLQ